ncbi:hypothetical protein PN462_07190 [Spirulina sp. CS-785/01]|uniref:hypothetical protein n=1 Tax=Spirulina sp. CS-785/01 TaxID=3021716 RepID=UPI00232C0D18|nr:hypothetical protein [Spirulina sp. CS-785/01]MDB9312880.1 hypothetical protein [Spirulina sp. CS-785/01]
MNNPKTPNLFQKFAGLLTLLGGGLYFTGWIYRWSYFSFFQLEITTLDFPHQSFLFVPLQVFFGSFASWFSILQTLSSILLFILVIYVGIPTSLWLLKQTSRWIVTGLNRLKIVSLNQYKKLRKTNSSISQDSAKPLLLKLQRFSYFILNKILNQINLKPIDYKTSLWDEIIIILWILLLLFFLARHQGISDARRDAGVNSKLPSITLITPDDTLAFGNTPDNPQTLEGFQIIGDIKRYRNIQNTPINDPDAARVWRLLLDHEGFFYLFKSLPKDASLEQRPIVLVIQGSLNGNQLVILSPSPVEAEKAQSEENNEQFSDE